MKRMTVIRIAILASVLAGSFYYFTTHRPGAPASDILSRLSRPDHVEITEAAAPQTFSAEEQADINLYKKVLPSVVNITSVAVAFDFFYGAVPQEGQGSGFLIDNAGHILTNYHVIQDARRVEVTLSNRKKYTAAIVGVDPANDLAVIRITARELHPATLGDSKGLQVGQRVYAIGNPFGLGGTFTHGIISSIRPVRGQNSFIDEAIQTDAAINPGNSGGPLLNSRGEVIGINTMILSQVGQSSGVGFAIPINAAKAVLNDLVTVGRVKRPTLGVRTIPIGPELAEELGLPSDHGVLIVQVIPGSSGEKAGLRGGSERAYLRNIPIMLGGDLIVAIDGDEIVDQMDLARAMNRHRAGDTVTVTIYRGKQKMDVKVTLQEAK
ncbi:MAG TPA: trypsin-like peptidase domain-containing protein [Terriglobales bacterium]|nr:trypsin-like peptidase domain-containing protein [Terriglobales bacterium]